MQNYDYLEPKTKSFVEKVEAETEIPIYKLPIEDARNVLNKVQEGGEKPSVAIEDKVIPGPNRQISIRIFKPQNLQEGLLSVVMFFHGGGWILGNKETHDRLCREVAIRTNAAVVFVNYSLSPEAKFPVAIEEAYAATAYIAKNGQAFGLDGSRLCVAGDSVGGNMAAVICLLAKERKGPKIALQVLFYPVTDANFDTSSYQQFAEGPWITKAAMEWFFDAYEPDKQARKKYTISPLQATLEQLKGLPAALVLTADNDVLRDEGEAYAIKLMQAGVEVTAIRMIGTIHDIVLLNAIAQTPAAKNSMRIACDMLTCALGQKGKVGLSALCN